MAAKTRDRVRLALHILHLSYRIQNRAGLDPDTNRPRKNGRKSLFGGLGLFGDDNDK